MDQSFPGRCYFNKMCLAALFFLKKLCHSRNTLPYEMSCLWLAFFFVVIQVNNISCIFRVMLASRHVKKLNHDINDINLPHIFALISGRSRGGLGPPLFLDQTGAWRAKKFFWTLPSLYLRVRVTWPPLIWRSASIGSITLNCAGNARFFAKDFFILFFGIESPWFVSLFSFFICRD